MTKKPCSPETGGFPTDGTTVERRKHRRLLITLPATIVTDGRRINCVISNASEEGMSSQLTTSIRTDIDFHPHNTVQLILELPHGVSVAMECDVRWFLRTPAREGSLMLGLHIPDPPDAYLQWLDSFTKRNR
jgi:hypothetical protein